MHYSDSLNSNFSTELATFLKKSFAKFAAVTNFLRLSFEISYSKAQKTYFASMKTQSGFETHDKQSLKCSMAKKQVIEKFNQQSLLPQRSNPHHRYYYFLSQYHLRLLC